jgi:hypothetical protein
MAALLADGPGRPLQQRPEIIIQDAVGAANDLLSHFEPSAVILSLPLFRPALPGRPEMPVFLRRDHC